jgi:hypothetical protein
VLGEQRREDKTRTRTCIDGLLVRIKMNITKQTREKIHGKARRMRTLGSELSKMKKMTILWKKTAKTPERIGEMTQEAKIPPTPAKVQLTQDGPRLLIVMPTIAPTMAWVVETGRLVAVAINKKIAPEISEPSIPRS